MVKELYIIVHEEIVTNSATKGSEAARKLLSEIRKIKHEQDYLEICDPKSPSELHPDMPPPSNDLSVIVLGGYRNICCVLQLFKLKESGYNAKPYQEAYLVNPKGRLAPGMIETILEKYPELERELS
jgi:hypothetical protein